MQAHCFEKQKRLGEKQCACMLCMEVILEWLAGLAWSG